MSKENQLSASEPSAYSPETETLGEGLHLLSRLESDSIRIFRKPALAYALGGEPEVGRYFLFNLIQEKKKDWK